MMPDLHQLLVEWILDPIDLWRLGKTKTLQYGREYQRTQFLSLKEIQLLQLKRYQELVLHAAKHCPYYTRLFEDAGFRPDCLNSFDDIRRIPILEKSHIQKCRNEMISKTTRKSALIPNKTGGSTGTPIKMFLDMQRHCSREAGTRRHNSWAGWSVGDKVAMVWGASPDMPTDMLKSRLRNLLLDRYLYLDTASVTDAKVRQFHKRFEKHRPTVILAYAQALVLVTKHMREAGLDVKHKPRSIVTSAEVLSDNDRELLEEFYGCKVFNRYGCREVSVIASECEQHDGLHVMAEGLYVEILNGDRPAVPGEVGSVVITDLLNYAMPLIRYRIGDMSSINYEPCKCGRGLPRLNSLDGRVTDFLVADDGKLVSGVFLATYLLAERPSLGQVQILQSRQGQVCFRLTGIGQPASELTQELDLLRRSVAKHLGERTLFEYEIVESIPNVASGKYTFCRSEVSAQLALANQECQVANVD